MHIATPRPVFDANSGGAAPFGDLPEWDLSDLYTAEDAPELTRDMGWLETECAAFAADYEGKLADLSADEMLTCVERYEQIDVIGGR
ncbi:MAG: oligoendopeptidase F, partial [Pseudomonadota bacterium]|nr:oligoendopeptidase F [Pseudomonadota bacterium]